METLASWIVQGSLSHVMFAPIQSFSSCSFACISFSVFSHLFLFVFRSTSKLLQFLYFPPCNPVHGRVQCLTCPIFCDPYPRFSQLFFKAPCLHVPRFASLHFQHLSSLFLAVFLFFSCSILFCLLLWCGVVVCEEEWWCLRWAW